MERHSLLMADRLHPEVPTAVQRQQLRHSIEA